MSLSQTCVAKLYASVIEDVIHGVREYFMDEGIDEQVLMELKQSWENRLKTTKAVEVNKPEPEPQPPPINHHRSGGSGVMPVDYNSNNISVHITLPSSVPNTPPRVLVIQVPPAAMQNSQLHEILSGPVIQATLALPDDMAAQMLQNHVTSVLRGQAARMGGMGMVSAAGGMANGVSSEMGGGNVPQVDGVRDSSDDDEEENDEEEDNDDEEEEKEEEEEEEDNGGVEEEPLNSGDDVSEEDPSGVFETDNVVVCQYDKISRSRNKWKFYLKDGIMNLGGKDFVFQKSNGDAEW